MGTKERPGKYDCYNKAEPDEPIFVLLGRDSAAPFAIRAWIEMRKAAGKYDFDQESEALDCLTAMEVFRKRRQAKKDKE